MADSKQLSRICIITTAHNALDERVFYKQALSLAQAGFEVSMIANWAAAKDSGPVKKLSLPVFNGKVNRILRGSVCAFWLALKEKAAVYHFHDPELLPLGLVLKCLGKRVIYDVHEDYSQKIHSRGLPPFVGKVGSRCFCLFEALCAASFDHIIVADSHVATLFPAAKTTLIANYPPLDFVKQGALTQAHDASAPFRLVYVGGISLIRGIGKILDALELLRDRPIEFHLAGPISDAGLLAQLKRHPQVFYHGVLPWEKVNELLVQADVGMVLFQPVPAFQYYPGENIIKLWEYLGLGLPVIISDFPKLKMLIETMEVGIAVDPTRPVAIAAAIRQLRDKPELRRKLGDNGRATVLKEHNWGNEAAKLVAVYQGLGL